jgi:hypothetical protein
MELYFCFCGVQSCETDSQFMVNKWWRLYTRYICGPIYEGKVPLGSLRRRICGRVVQVSSGTWSFDGFKTDVIRRARGCNHWLTVRRDATRRQRSDTREFTASVLPLFFGSSYLGHCFFDVITWDSAFCELFSYVGYVVQISPWEFDAHEEVWELVDPTYTQSFLL